MPVDRDDTDERAARIEALLEEARSKTQLVREDVERTTEATQKGRRQAKAGLEAARRNRSRKKPA